MKLISVIATLLLTPAAQAQDIPGRFDYYVLSLSWSPSWCRAEGEESDAEQCDTGRRLGFVVHGLWPQYERGWPSDCRTDTRDPSRRETRAMADIMGSGGLAWYQWKKHGRCSSLSAQDYFSLTRKAADSIIVPEALRHLGRDIALPARVVEDAFIEANPTLTRDGITVTCRNNALQEVRICLTRELQPRACAPDAQRDCRGDFLLPAPR
ncbi:ribonuclease T2 family protein [Paracoccus sp. J56]|uniref:ribonuclease T2 family protein n=1 Tax=Paracoccus sp. J56 TaxID=935850 RepID=UPI000A0CC7DB|nr:ribonuclease T2 [Paracoccus sp. J56]SMG51030.1 ribonuclease T2 [Paracoccus sp. J56]